MQSFSSQGQGSSKALSDHVPPFPYSYEDIGLDRLSDLPKLHSPLVARLMSMSSEGTKVSTRFYSPSCSVHTYMPQCLNIYPAL